MDNGHSVWAARADAAAAAVDTLYGHRLLGLPGTWIAAVAHPAPAARWPWSEWHYWWQAQYLDVLVDAAARCGADTGTAPAPGLGRIRALLRTIRLRNFARFRNGYFDDMAWLALAAGRAGALARGEAGPGFRGARRAHAVLGRRLAAGHSERLGGGIYWSTARDYKNTPANGPAALYFARAGSTATARSLVDWLRTELFDPVQGLYLDGVHPVGEDPLGGKHDGTGGGQEWGREVERTIYSYNQGPVLGALLELGGPAYLGQAAELVGAIARELTVDGGPGAGRPLVLHGAGDGGLFTGILLRYLALAAIHPQLPPGTRKTAAELVLDTALALWAARRPEPFLAFPQDTGAPAADSFAQADAVGLSSQLQAWMAFEAAAAVAVDSAADSVATGK
ncbi:glycoside hydrolase family 76 protein [Pseudarthrobacter sp. P1]|uniref:glycoside hydrolase family 76 protein n=1 Tax=Pseudarthrobacter sp. P1 TaxID=3418418 RepID=UPI003CF74DB4